jgi:hypothetical protein
MVLAAATVLFAGCVVVATPPPPGPPPPAAAEGLSWEPGTDRPGSDYRNFDVRLPHDCREACARDPRCRAFTDRGGRCWLKERVPMAVADACCTSGAKGIGPDTPPPAPLPTTALSFELRTDRPGSDYNHFPAANPEVCRDACAPEPRCRAFTFRGGTCWLKQVAPNPIHDDCCVSGARL